MRISKKQRDEINFLAKEFGNSFVPTEEECQEYINHTVHGGKRNEDNRLFMAKRGLDISIKMWRDDLVIGQLGVNELSEDFGGGDYVKTLIHSIVKGISPQFRRKTLTKNKDLITSMALTNFPELWTIK